MTGWRTLARQAISGYLSGGMILLLGIASSVVVGRTQGPTVQGEVQLMLGFNAIATFVATLGVGLSNFADLPVRPGFLRTAHRISMWCAGLLGLSGVITALLFRAIDFTFWGVIPRRAMDAALFALPVTLYGSYWSTLMLGTDRVHLAFWGTGGLAAVGFVGIIVACFANQSPAIVPWAWMGSTAAFGVILFTVACSVARSDCDHTKHDFYYELRRTLRFGFSGYLGGIATHIWTRLDVWLLSLNYGVSAVGIYSAATSIADRIRQAILPISYSLMYRMAREQTSSARRMLFRVAMTVGLVLLIPVLVLVLLSRQILTLLFGEAFADADLPLLLLSVGAYFGALASLLTPYYVAHLRRPLTLSIIAWVMVAVGLVLCLWLIPKFGLAGAAMATGAIQILGFLFGLMCTKLPSS